MKHRTILAAAVLAVAGPGCGTALAAAPDLAACPRPKPPLNTDRERKTALPVPAALRAVVRANLLNYAVATQTGTTICVDTGWMESAEWDMAVPSARYLSFRWSGYEAGGYYLIDRTGRGQAIDTGEKPVFSPSQGKFAAIEISESGFGSLNGFAVWQANPTGVRRLAFLDNLPRMSDWRIDGWSGEACINLSSIPMDKYPENAADLPRVSRTRFTARPGPGGWRVIAAKAGCPRG